MPNPDYLELLKMIGRGIEPHMLQEEFDHPWDYSNFINMAQDRKHAHKSKVPDGREIFRLSPEGESYLKKESQLTKKWYKKHEWWGIIITGIIGIAALLVAIFRP